MRLPVLHRSHNMVLVLIVISSLPTFYLVKYLRSEPWLRVDQYILTNTELIQESYSQRYVCKERRHFAFIKIPKTGSSTVQNIFFRFGLRRNLTFLLPNIANYISYWPRISERYIIPPPTGKTYDLVCNHVMYNRSAFDRVMPSDTLYVTNLRNPLDNFLSYLRYYYPKTFSRKDDLQKYLDNLRHFMNLKRPFKIPPNIMSDYLGLNEMFAKSTSDRWDFIEKFKNEVDFVLILEHLDESLLLMKRKFCWELQDILYFPKMVSNRNRSLNHDKYHLEIYRQLSMADQMLYDYFKRDLLKQIEEQKWSDDFLEELSFFRTLLQRSRAFCKPSLADSQTLEVAESPWSRSFAITRQDCRLLLMEELSLQRYVGIEQYGVERWKKLHDDKPKLH